MSIKDKIIFSIMFLLIAGGAYIQFSYFQAMDQMAIWRQNKSNM